MKKNKGFTLIELLAIVMILTIVFAMVAYFTFGYLEKSKKTACEATINTIENAARAYVAKPKFAGKNHENLTIYDLAYEGLIEKDFVNPKTGRPVSDQTPVKIFYIPSAPGSDKGKYCIEVILDGCPVRTCNQ